MVKYAMLCFPIVVQKEHVSYAIKNFQGIWSLLPGQNLETWVKYYIWPTDEFFGYLFKPDLSKATSWHVRATCSQQCCHFMHYSPQNFHVATELLPGNSLKQMCISSRARFVSSLPENRNDSCSHLHLPDFICMAILSCCCPQICLLIDQIALS